MSTLYVRLFGKFSVWMDERAVAGLDVCKVQELLCYLLLHDKRPHAREALAGQLWGESTTAQSKKYLRQALWQLRTVLDASAGAGKRARLLLVDPDWVQIDPQADLSVDVDDFEQSFARARNVSGRELDDESVAALRAAVELYRGDLLEGCYQDWCLYKREQLQSAYLSILDKLMSSCEVRREYEAGVSYGERILRYDRARECTHRRLMRLLYLANDRTGALRQYERCAAALAQELSVNPSRSTTALYEQIRADRFDEQPAATEGTHAPVADGVPSSFASTLLPEALSRLKLLQDSLLEIQKQIQQAIKSSGGASETALKDRR